MSNAALTRGTAEARADAGADSHAWRRAPREACAGLNEAAPKRAAVRGSRAAAGESSTAPNGVPCRQGLHRRNPPAASTIPQPARWARSQTLMPTLPRDRIRTPGGVRHWGDRAARAERQPGVQPTCICTPGGVRHGRPAAKRSRVLLPSPFPRYSLGRGYESLVIPATIRTLFNPVFTSEEPPRCSAPTPPPAPS